MRTRASSSACLSFSVVRNSLPLTSGCACRSLKNAVSLCLSLSVPLFVFLTSVFLL